MKTENALTFLRLHKEAPLPVRAYNESAAWDLSAFTMEDEGRPRTRTLAPRHSMLIRTGLALRAPPGNVLLVCSRSGLATRSIFVANAPGVIDPDYTGEIQIILFNGGLEPYYVKHGDRIAQVLVVPLTVCNLLEVSAFEPTNRGEKGFGSTGA